MKTITVSDKEMEVLKHAVEVINDITTDTLLDDTCLFPSLNQAVVIEYEAAQHVRDEIYDATNKLIAIRTLMAKLGLNTNEAGYSV